MLKSEFKDMLKRLSNLFKKETPDETLRRLHPELFDESGKTYNCGTFEDTNDAYEFQDSEIVLFPELDSVFVNASDFEKRCFLPLCSFDLKIVNKDWDVQACFLDYLKSQESDLENQFYISEYGDYHVTVFNVVDGKISINGNEKVFSLTEDEIDFWHETQKVYNENKNGKLNFDFSTKLVRQVNASPMWVQSEENPVPVNDENIFFIGQLEKSLLNDNSGWIFLFYSPEKNIFIQVEQWT